MNGANGTGNDGTIQSQNWKDPVLGHVPFAVAHLCSPQGDDHG